MMASEKGNEGWKNPNDIMRVHRINRRRKSCQRPMESNSSKTLLSDQKNSISPSLSNDNTSDNTHKKRKNPFFVEQEVPPKQIKTERNQLEPVPVENAMLASSGNSKECNKSGIHQLSMINGKATEQFEAEMNNRRYSENLGDVLGERNENYHSNVSSSKDDSHSGADNKEQALNTCLPLDWSLKQKMRVVTNLDINSKAKLYPGLEARNLHGFVHSQFNNEAWNDLDTLSQIKRCCYHYTFPNIPGLNKFPRLSSHYGNRPSPIDTSRQDVILALQSEWSRSFISVYQQLRSGLCPYFYVCTHQFTVLFKCIRNEEKCVLSALLSPSTRGFRELLKQEDVTFKMPKAAHIKDSKRNLRRDSSCRTDVSLKENVATGRCKSQDNSQNPSQDSAQTLDCTGDHARDTTTDSSEKNEVIKDEDDDDDDDDDDSHEDDAASSWLEEIGLESKHFPSLLPQNVKVQKERFQDIDNRLHSLLYMEGLDVHAFFNFLMNYPSCIASSGPQYGLPPTILSPSPFQGGALVVNTVKLSAIQDVAGLKKSDGNKAKEKDHVLEINGPILPHHALNVMAVLQSKSLTTSSSSTASFSCHQPSTAFNSDFADCPASNILLSGLGKLLVPFSSLDVGLLPHVKDSLLSEPSITTKEVSVSMKNISWSS